MTSAGFRLALVGPSSPQAQEFMACLERGAFPLSGVLRMGTGEGWQGLEETGEGGGATPEPLPPLDLGRLGEVDAAVLSEVPPEVREGVLEAASAGDLWVLDLDGGETGPWVDPFGEVASFREAGFHLVLPDPGALYAARLGGALGPFLPVAFSARRFLPASTYGEPGVRQLHAQATDLLGFRPPEPGVFGSQLAFNLLPLDPGGGPSAWVRQVRALWPGCPPATCSSLLAPTFHGAAVSLDLLLEGSPAEACQALGRAFGEGTALRPSQVPHSPVEASNLEGAHFCPQEADGNWLRIWVVYDNVRAGAAALGARILATLAAPD